MEPSGIVRNLVYTQHLMTIFFCSEPSQKDLSVMYPTPPSMENHHQDMDLDGSATMVQRADMVNGSCKMEHDVKANVEDIKVSEMWHKQG